MLTRPPDMKELTKRLGFHIHPYIVVMSQVFLMSILMRSTYLLFSLVEVPNPSHAYLNEVNRPHSYISEVTSPSHVHVNEVNIPHSYSSEVTIPSHVYLYEVKMPH